MYKLHISSLDVPLQAKQKPKNKTKKNPNQTNKKTHRYDRSVIHIKHILNARKMQLVNLPTMDSKVELLYIYFIAFIKTHHSFQHQKHTVKGIFPLNNGVFFCSHSMDITKYY